jgi:hypothetical protein
MSRLPLCAEISYDLVMHDDMAFVEGTYRLPGGDWQVFIFGRGDVSDPEVTPQRWRSGVTGLFIRFPHSAALNRAVVEHILSGALGVTEWVEISGPDSMQLR